MGEESEQIKLAVTPDEYSELKSGLSRLYTARNNSRRKYKPKKQRVKYQNNIPEIDLDEKKIYEDEEKIEVIVEEWEYYEVKQGLKRLYQLRRNSRKRNKKESKKEICELNIEEKIV